MEEEGVVRMDAPLTTHGSPFEVMPWHSEIPNSARHLCGPNSFKETPLRFRVPVTGSGRS